MIGWLIAAGIIGALVSSSETNTTYVVQAPSRRDFGDSIPYSHKKCNSCGNAHVSAYVIDRNNSFVKLKFVCNHCGRAWAKSYRIDV